MEHSHASHRSRARGRRAVFLIILLGLPLVATLIPEVFNRSGPAIGGMPFFYWWQLLWIAGVAICTGIAYRITRSPR